MLWGHCRLSLVAAWCWLLLSVLLWQLSLLLWVLLLLFLLCAKLPA